MQQINSNHDTFTFATALLNILIPRHFQNKELHTRFSII